MATTEGSVFVGRISDPVQGRAKTKLARQFSDSANDLLEVLRLCLEVHSGRRRFLRKASHEKFMAAAGNSSYDVD